MRGWIGLTYPHHCQIRRYRGTGSSRRGPDRWRWNDREAVHHWV